MAHEWDDVTNNGYFLGMFQDNRTVHMLDHVKTTAAANKMLQPVPNKHVLKHIDECRRSNVTCPLNTKWKKNYRIMLELYYRYLICFLYHWIIFCYVAIETCT